MATKVRSVLKNLTKSDILTAFKKTRPKYEIPGVRLELVTEKHYTKALEMCRGYFVPLEPINKAVGLQYTQELEDMWMDVLKLNLSMLLLDEHTDDTVALMTTGITYLDDDLDPESFKDKPLRDVMRFIRYCEDKSEFFKRYNTNEAFNLLGLAVGGKYKRHGYASDIILATLDMIRNFEFEEVCVKADGTSNFSKKIFEKLGFETLYEGIYDKYEVDGKFPIQNTGVHKSTIVYGLKVTKNIPNQK